MGSSLETGVKSIAVCGRATGRHGASVEGRETKMSIFGVSVGTLEAKIPLARGGDPHGVARHFHATMHVTARGSLTSLSNCSPKVAFEQVPRNGIPFHEQCCILM